MSQCIARTRSLKRCKNSVGQGNLLFCQTHRFWGAAQIVAVALTGTTIWANISTIFNNPVIPTRTPTPTPLLTVTASPSITVTASPPPGSQSQYYMIVLDASEAMKEAFDGRSKWEAARESVDFFLDRLNEHSNYGLIVVGDSPNVGAVDPCGEPSDLRIPFGSRDTVRAHIDTLQPMGGGSLSEAFTLAKNELENLRAGTVKTLIYITGSKDACDVEDEWRQLEKILQLPNLVGLYSEIIIVEEHIGMETQTIAQHISSLSPDLHVQISQSNAQLQQNMGTTIEQVNTHVEQQQAVMGNSPPVDSAPIPSLTPQVVVNVPPATVAVIPPTPIPPSPVPASPIPPTAAPAPSVQLLSAEYIGSGEGCSANISFQVSDGPVTGQFRVWNKWYDTQTPRYDARYPMITVPTGTETFQVGLGGHGNPEYYSHKVWFYYNGVASNVLSDLICPGLVPVP